MNSKKAISSEGNLPQIVSSREIASPASMPAHRWPRFVTTVLRQAETLRSVLSERPLSTILIVIILIALILRGIEIRISDIIIIF